MFKGRYDHAIDAKGRTSLPARFRDLVCAAGDDRVVVTHALDAKFPHLDIYPFARWAQFEEKLAAQPIFDENVIMLKRLYVANAVECNVDSHGRILLSGAQRSFAGLENDAVWVGMTRIIELWTPDRWAAAQASAARSIDDVRAGLASFEL